MKLTIWQKINVALGRKYLLNRATGEVHLLTNLSPQCGAGRIARRNRRYITGTTLHRLRLRVPRQGEVKINGCRWCLGKLDTDRKTSGNGK